MTYVYRQTEPSLWTVGYYDPSGAWHPNRDCGSSDYAAALIAWLNGSNDNPGAEREWLQRQSQDSETETTMRELRAERDAAQSARDDANIARMDMAGEMAELHQIIAAQRDLICALHRRLMRIEVLP